MLLRITTLLLVTYTAVAQKPTPCPGIFSYQDRESDSDRWYGELRFPSPEDVTGIWLQIVLDRPADILGNWFGPVTTFDNTAFVVRKQDDKLQVGQYFYMRFFVKFNLAKPIPSLVDIKFNGKEICGPATGQADNVMPLSDKEPIDPNQVTQVDSKPIRLVEQTPSPVFSYEDPKKSCGIIASRATPLIFEGQETTPGQWPWHAALYHHKGFEIQYACGSTLITDQHVVTAAHCVSDAGTRTVKDKSDISIGLGKYDLKTYEEDFQHLGILDIYVHPQYNPWSAYNDIAVLKLSSPVQITGYVRPCCLWDEDSSLSNIISRQGIVVGWGVNGEFSSKLMQAKMPVVSTRDCISSKKDFREFVSENNFCAGFRNGTAACRGDSGGGMVFPKTDENGQTVWQIRGIVSLSLVPNIKDLCETSNYNIFTDVAKFIPWIQNIINNY